FDVHASRLGSPLEPVLSIHEASGRELPSALEHHGLDPMLIFEPPADGTYLLKVRDLEYRGGGNFDYRIDAGAIPYLESLLPMSIITSSTSPIARPWTWRCWRAGSARPSARCCNCATPRATSSKATTAQRTPTPASCASWTPATTSSRCAT